MSPETLKEAIQAAEAFVKEAKQIEITYCTRKSK